MKNFCLLSIILFTLFSCQNEIKFNNSSVQGLKDNNFWRALKSSAVINTDGSLIIEGIASDGKLSLNITGTTLKTYLLATDDSAKAVFTTSEGVVFSTGLNKGNGQIVITEYDIVNNTVSGTFKFNVIGQSNSSSPVLNINFREGVFNKITISGH